MELIDKAIDILKSEMLPMIIPIVRHYKGFIILAQTERDFEGKKDSINHGDTNGFYTVERMLSRIIEE